MLNSEPKASGNRNIMKFASATAAMALLAGCAVAVPLPPLTTFSQDSRHLVCTGSSKCRNGNQVAYRRSQPVGVSKIDDDPPNFILNNGDQDGTPPSRTISPDLRRFAFRAYRARRQLGSHAPPLADLVVERMRHSCLDGVHLVSDRQPTRAHATV
jgi:hypothetical protein